MFPTRSPLLIVVHPSTQLLGLFTFQQCLTTWTYPVRNLYKNKWSDLQRQRQETENPTKKIENEHSLGRAKLTFVCGLESSFGLSSQAFPSPLTLAFSMQPLCPFDFFGGRATLHYEFVWLSRLLPFPVSILLHISVAKFYVPQLPLEKLPAPPPQRPACSQEIPSNKILAKNGTNPGS